MQRCYNLQPKRSRLFRHDIIQKKHSIIQRSIKSPPEHCIPTVGAGISIFICCCRLPLAQRAVAEPGHNQKLQSSLSPLSTPPFPLAPSACGRCPCGYNIHNAIVAPKARTCVFSCNNMPSSLRPPIGFRRLNRCVKFYLFRASTGRTGSSIACKPSP